MVTALLVTVYSRCGVPASTSHVSVGALFGICSGNQGTQWKVVRTIVPAWFTTLPIGALLAALAYATLRSVA